MVAIFFNIFNYGMIGEKIKLIREFRAKTQQQIADKIGISVTSYAKLKRGEVDITITRLELVCKALQIKPFILFLPTSPIQVIGEKLDLNEFL